MPSNALKFGFGLISCLMRVEKLGYFFLSGYPLSTETTTAEEIQSYDSEAIPAHVDKSDPLRFWHLFKPKYPRLCGLAVELFAIPASQAAAKGISLLQILR